MTGMSANPVRCSNCPKEFEEGDTVYVAGRNGELCLCEKCFAEVEAKVGPKTVQASLA